MNLEDALAGFAASQPGAAAKLAHSQSHYLALTRWLAAQVRPGRALVVGIHGTQGSGKSTLASFAQYLLEQAFGRRTVAFSIDDFYLTRAERQALAREVHPLLATRGVPGTHDVGLARDVLARLGAGETVRLPRFVKARDDRAPESEWPECRGPVDVVLFDGWCVGTPPQPEDELAAPANELEAKEDADGRWRAYVNAQLAGPYTRLFAALDRLVMLQAPGFDVVFGWRLEQEAGNVAAVPGSSGMAPDALKRFIAHYERLTRHALRVLPARADVVLRLDEQRRVTAARYRNPGSP